MVRIEDFDDELTGLVRDARIHESEVSEDDLTRMRAQFVRNASVPTGAKIAPAPMIRRRWLWAGLGGIVATGTAAAVTATLVMAPVSTTPPAESVNAFPGENAPLTVSLAMNRAAENAADPADLLVRADQWLRIEVTETQLLEWNDDPEPEEVTDETGSIPTERPIPDILGAVQITDVRTLYVPGDPSGDWIWVREPDTVGQAWGTRTAEQIIEASQMQLDTESRIVRFPAGVGPAPDGPRPGRISQGSLPFDQYAPYYDEMPTEPQALLDWYRSRIDENSDASIITGILESPTANVAPAEIRAATFRAIALIKGVEVVSSDEKTTTMRFRDDPNGATTVFTIDMERGYLLSVNRTYDSTSSIVPDDLPGLSTTFQISVTDEAPTLS